MYIARSTCSRSKRGMERSVRRKLVRRTREPQRKRTRFGLVTQPESEESARDDEPATGGEATGKCSRRAFRGGWGQRAWTDQSRILGDPTGRVRRRAQRRAGIYNRLSGSGGESERPIGARKSGNADGAKGPY